MQPPAPPFPSVPPLPPEAVQVFVPGGPPTAELVLIFTLIIVAGIVLYPIAKALGRRLEGGAARAGSPESGARLERLEQAVDAMAIEVERISEGQRYTTKLLTERLPLAVKVPDAHDQDKTLR